MLIREWVPGIEYIEGNTLHERLGNLRDIA